VLKHEIFFCHVDSPGEFLALCFIIDLFYWNIILETPKMEGNGINKDPSYPSNPLGRSRRSKQILPSN
jgi:hypothetical protein